MGNPAADKYFLKQRRQADTIDEKTSRPFFKLMQRVGAELHHATLGFATKTYPENILDMYTPPGGCLMTAMKMNPYAETIAFSLPPSDGGYSVFLPEDK
jgi:hypothetical protein